MHDNTSLITAESVMEKLGDACIGMINYHDNDTPIVASHEKVDEIWNRLNKFPQDTTLTEEQFAALSWPEIKKLAEQCAAGDKTDFEYMLGYGKPVNTTYGDTVVRLKALNNMEKASGGMSGFYFEADDLFVASSLGDYDLADCPGPYCWTGSNSSFNKNPGSYTEDVLTNLYNSLPTDLQNIVEEVIVLSVSCTDGGYSNLSILDYNNLIRSNNKCFVPSYMNLTGEETYGKEGTWFDWYKIHNTSQDRIKIAKNSSSYFDNWDTRTPKKEGYYYGRITINNKNGDFSFLSYNERAIPLCFCV